MLQLSKNAPSGISSHFLTCLRAGTITAAAWASWATGDQSGPSFRGVPLPGNGHADLLRLPWGHLQLECHQVGDPKQFALEK